MGNKILRCPQHDSAVTHTDAWINLLNFIIGPRWMFRYLHEKVKKHHCAPTNHQIASHEKWVLQADEVHNAHTRTQQLQTDQIE